MSYRRDIKEAMVPITVVAICMIGFFLFMAIMFVFLGDPSVHEMKRACADAVRKGSISEEVRQICLNYMP